MRVNNVAQIAPYVDHLRQIFRSGVSVNNVIIVESELLDEAPSSSRSL